jgi:hypothetical protein
MIECGRMEGGSAQIGVDDHPCRIDDPTEPGLDLAVDLPLKKGKEVFHRKAFMIQTGEIILIQDFCPELL